MIEPYQVTGARALGADCILLIMAMSSTTSPRPLDEAAHLWAWMCWWKCMTKPSWSGRWPWMPP